MSDDLPWGDSSSVERSERIDVSRRGVISMLTKLDQPRADRFELANWLAVIAVDIAEIKHRYELVEALLHSNGELLKERDRLRVELGRYEELKSEMKESS